jgi:hypothetical protein
MSLGLDLESWLVQQAGIGPALSKTEKFCDALRQHGPKSTRTRAALREIEPCAELYSTTTRLFLRATAAHARPLLATWVKGLSPDLGLSFDLPPLGTSEALEHVFRETGHDLSSARVRAHIARARLVEFEFLVRVPEGSVDEALEDAVQLFVESLLGDREYEDWIGALTVSPLPFKRSLLVVADGAVQQHYPIQETSALVQAVRTAMDPGRVMPSPRTDPWFALEFEPQHFATKSPQDRQRSFASTCVPAALKGAFEGLPFASHRFFPDGFELMSLKWERDDAAGGLRDQVEACLADLGQDVLVVGSGFGPAEDFLDLLLPFEKTLFSAIVARVGELGARGQLEFYRTDYRDLRLPFRAN